MAFITHQYTYPIRPLPIRPNRARSSSKELQWTSAYDNVLNQYVNAEGLDVGTCNPAALAYPIAALNEPSPVVPSVYPEPSQHNRLWSANSFDAKDIHQPSPTFSPWMGDESEINLHQSMSTQPTARIPSYHNDLSMSGLRICYDPTLAPSRVEETIKKRVTHTVNITSAASDAFIRDAVTSAASTADTLIERAQSQVIRTGA
ncbi:hypothetical protein E4T49_01370 [Aureobasidium sp. EXF-10728]|nr:hypothetical protein E4T49_01370 [Aureobasidium sp. EXF-10728]